MWRPLLGGGGRQDTVTCCSPERILLGVAVTVEVSSTLPSERLEGAVQWAPGQRCGAWKLERHIASGGFGHVFEAEREDDLRRAAIKVLRPELCGSAEAVARFEREAALLQSLAMPGFVKLYEFGRVTGGSPFFAMELLVGEDLKQRIATRGRVSAIEALSIVSPLCESLAFAHARGVVHRDVKPSNVFISSGAQSPTRVSILDFGLAKLLDEDAASLTVSRQILGTPASMAPEQIVGGAVDARTDIYALGALLFQLLSGEAPFRDDSPHVLCQLHLHARVPNVSALAPVDAAFDGIIARAMSKRREHRYSSCDEFFAACRAVAGAGPATESGAALRTAEVIAVCAATRRSPGAPPLAADASLRQDFEQVLPLARSALERAGLKVALRAGDLLLLFDELPADSAAAHGTRQRTLEAALSLDRQLAARVRRHPALTVSIGVVVGPAELRGAKLVGGTALIHAQRAARAVPEGLATTPALVEDLNVSTTTCEDSQFVRVLAASS